QRPRSRPDGEQLEPPVRWTARFDTHDDDHSESLSATPAYVGVARERIAEDPGAQRTRRANSTRTVSSAALNSPPYLSESYSKRVICASAKLITPGLNTDGRTTREFRGRIWAPRNS